MLTLLSPCILCCCCHCFQKIAAENENLDEEDTAGQVVGGMVNTYVPEPQTSPEYNLVSLSDIPVPPGFNLLPLSELHGPQAPPAKYILVKIDQY